MKCIKLLLCIGVFYVPFLVKATPPFGTFTSVAGSPFPAETRPTSIAFSPLASGNLFAAVSNQDSNTISVYSVNQATGVFQQVVGSPFPTGNDPFSIAFSPLASGNLFAVVANIMDDEIVMYSVNQATGAFVSAGGQFPGGETEQVAFSPVVSGNLFVAVSGGGSDDVTTYLVNQTTGALMGASTAPTASFAAGIAFSPLASGNLYAAVANESSNNVSVYLVNQATGAFTQVAGSPFLAGTVPTGVAFSPIISGNLYAAVTNSASNNVSVYLVNQATGAFTQVAGSPFLAGTNLRGIAFSPVVSGSLFAAVANFGSNNVSVYTVDPATGAFTSIVGSPFLAETQPFGVSFSPLISGNLFAAVTNLSSDNVSVYQVTIPPQSMGPVSEISAAIIAKYCSLS